MCLARPERQGHKNEPCFRGPRFKLNHPRAPRTSPPSEQAQEGPASGPGAALACLPPCGGPPKLRVPTGFLGGCRALR